MFILPRSKTNLLRMYFWPWIFMILLVIIIICFLIFKLELRWKDTLSITYINHMSCLSTMTADFRSILSSITSSTSINHCLELITKNLSLCCVPREQIIFKDDMGSRERSTILAMSKCSSQSSEISVLWYHIKK